MILPPHLFPGARVALVAPAGPVSAERAEGALARCRALGLEPILGSAALERNGYLAGDDARRAADLQRAIDDPGVDGIWALRGGYGTMRLLPLLDLGPLAERPKPFIGFSDNTTLHLALARLGVASYHGPHPGESVTPVTDECFRRVLFEPEAAGPLPLPEAAPRVCTLVAGVAEGPLVGGNLALAAAACGTPAAMTSEGKVVFLEDVGEPAYRLDRMLMQLRLAGALDGAVGLALGRFTEVEPQTNDRPVDAVFREVAESLGVPAVLGLPIGHVADNWTLPLGVRARLDAGAGMLSLVEPAVSGRF
ncbi:MAG TPA: LD-carboxypeptidase [Longimicrobiales bacterium]|nr:LD-carboxypeptidase [Longimicrobiales bacterium]